MIFALKIFGKMFLAIVCGALIGVDRTLAAKQAGIKTHALLALATCSLTCLSEVFLFEETPRVIAGIIQGIGFLGAGVIHMSRDKHTVRGLTSSVVLWLAAVDGIICATDYWYIAFCPIILYYFVTKVLIQLELKLKEKAIDYDHLDKNWKIEEIEDDD